MTGDSGFCGRNRGFRREPQVSPRAALSDAEGFPPSAGNFGRDDEHLIGWGGMFGRDDERFIGCTDHQSYGVQFAKGGNAL
jgi:hypothetical protein